MALARGSAARLGGRSRFRAKLAVARRHSLYSTSTPGASPAAIQVACYAGDGIGADVTDATFRMLAAVQSAYGFVVEPTFYDWGCDYCDVHGVCAPDNMIDILKPYDAIFLGAVGFPSRYPDHITLEPLIRMRQAFDQFACVRPARTYPGVPTPLAANPTVDMIVVRENSEGEYVNNGGRFSQGQPNEVAIQSAVHTRKGVERVLRHGFELAMKPERRQKLTMVTKSNAQRYAMVLWDDVLEELTPEYPSVKVDKQHIDAISMNFVRMPETFDIVVASNLFGDILTDLSGAITGSLGLNPSANLNVSRDYPSLFEPVHGSAPDIAGMGIANPAGAFLSAAMMLDWLGHPIPATAIRESCTEVLCHGATPDVGGAMGTIATTDAVIEAMLRRAPH